MSEYFDYNTALELAGAVVHDYEIFGCYSGDWCAHVTYNGVTGFVIGGYGTCPYCDDLENIGSCNKEAVKEFAETLLQDIRHNAAAFEKGWHDKEVFDWIKARERKTKKKKK